MNNYKLERFVYTNGFVKFLDSKQVYSISNQDNKEVIEAKKRKNIVFYRMKYYKRLIESRVVY